MQDLTWLRAIEDQLRFGPSQQPILCHSRQWSAWHDNALREGIEALCRQHKRPFSEYTETSWANDKMAVPFIAARSPRDVLFISSRYLSTRVAICISLLSDGRGTIGRISHKADNRAFRGLIIACCATRRAKALNRSASLWERVHVLEVKRPDAAPLFA